MKIRSLCAVLITIAVLGSNDAHAAMAGAGTRDSAFYAISLARLSVGLDAGAAEREVDSKTMPLLSTRSAGGFVGIDLVDWLTLFGTAGAAEFKYKGDEGYGGSQFKWSAGLQANVWRYDIVDPKFLEGTLMIKALCEYSDYDFNDPDYRNTPKWTDLTFAIPISYEMYVERQDTLDRIPYSMALSIGPAASMIDGTERGNLTFGETTSVGAMGAVDIYLSHNLSLGFVVYYYDNTAMGGNLIYHF